MHSILHWQVESSAKQNPGRDIVSCFEAVLTPARSYLGFSSANLPKNKAYIACSLDDTPKLDSSRVATTANGSTPHSRSSVRDGNRVKVIPFRRPKVGIERTVVFDRRLTSSGES